MVLGSFLLNTLNATAVAPLKLKLMNELHVLERNANVGLSDLGFEDLDENLKLSLDPVGSYEAHKQTSSFFKIKQSFFCVFGF